MGVAILATLDIFFLGLNTWEGLFGVGDLYI